MAGKNSPTVFSSLTKNLKKKPPAGPLSADSSCRCFSDEDASDNHRNPRLRVAKDSADGYITVVRPIPDDDVYSGRHSSLFANVGISIGTTYMQYGLSGRMSFAF